MTPYPTTSDQKTTGKQTGGAIHKPEAPPSHSRQEQVTSIKTAEHRIHVRQNPGNEATDASQSRGRGNIQPSQSGQFDTGVDVPAILEGPTKPVREAIDISRPHHPALPHPYAVNDNAIHEPGWRRHPSNQAGTTTWPGSRRPSSFSLPIGSLTQHATAHAGTSTVHATPAGAPRVPLTPRRAPRQRAVVTNRKGKRR